MINSDIYIYIYIYEKCSLMKIFILFYINGEDVIKMTFFFNKKNTIIC